MELSLAFGFSLGLGQAKAGQWAEDHRSCGFVPRNPTPVASSMRMGTGVINLSSPHHRLGEDDWAVVDAFM